MPHNVEIKITSDFIDLLGLRTSSLKPQVLAEFTANQDNLDITNGTLFYISADALRDVTGLTRGFDGRKITLFNIGVNAITLKNDNAGSLEQNRILNATGGDLTIPPLSLVRLFYDGSSATLTDRRWRSESVAISTSGDILTLNSQGPDGAGNMALTPGALDGQETTFVNAAGTIEVIGADWHHFTFMPTNIGATSVVVYGTFVVPASQKVIKVRMGARRTDDTADAGILASATRESGAGSPEKLSTALQYPVTSSFATAVAAGTRVILAMENTTGTARDVFGQISLLLENV